ncbi:MAG TPA: hypothetical protein VFP19_08990 [Candidatus Limnocylindrales bacterium]|nr:hypothetical protein [Candidatus Limnocylindrales bacterium]
MRVYASPRRGYCASCDTLLTGRPVYHMDETYCCLGCAEGGPCMCSYEEDLASDGVDHLGLPFVETAPTEAIPVRSQEPVRELAPVR